MEVVVEKVEMVAEKVEEEVVNRWGNLWNWHSLFLLYPSQILTYPSLPPVAKVL